MFTVFPELVRSAWASDEERLAIWVHRYFGSGAPLRTRMEYEEMLNKAGGRLCYDTSLDSFGTVLITEERFANPVFCIKKDIDWIEQRFLIAQLFGRFLFDYQVKLVTGHPKMTSTVEQTSPYQRFLLCKRAKCSHFQRREKRILSLSDEFAGALLLPKLWLRKFVEEEKDPLRIANHFAIPLNFLHARIKHIRQRQQILTSLRILPREDTVHYNRLV